MGSNRTTRLAQAAGCHLWTRGAEAPKVDGPGGKPGQGGGVGGAQPAGAERIVSLRVPKFEALVREYDARWLAHGAATTRRHQRTVLRQAVAALPEFPTDQDVRRWLEGKIAAGRIVGTTANAYLGVLGRCYAAAGAAHGLPNPIRAIDPFPEAPPIPRAIPGDQPGGRLAVVEQLQALACQNDVDRALLALAFDTGLRIEELVGLRLAEDLDLVRGTVHVQGQRSPLEHHHRARAKTLGSHARVNLSPEAVEWVVRAMRAPERLAWGGPWKGKAARDRLAATFLFPYTQRQLDNLLKRIRAVAPAAFPRRNAWHVFRHSLASDMDDVRGPDGKRVYTLADIGERLRHTHGEWTRTYVERLRGRECETALDALRAHRASQRAAMHQAAGVSGIPARDTKHAPAVDVGGGDVVESAACKGKSAAGSWWGSTHDSGSSHTPHVAPVAPPTQRGLPLGPIGAVPARVRGRRGAR